MLSSSNKPLVLKRYGDQSALHELVIGYDPDHHIAYLKQEFENVVVLFNSSNAVMEDIVRAICKFKKDYVNIRRDFNDARVKPDKSTKLDTAYKEYLGLFDEELRKKLDLANKYTQVQSLDDLNGLARPFPLFRFRHAEMLDDDYIDRSNVLDTFTIKEGPGIPGFDEDVLKKRISKGDFFLPKQSVGGRKRPRRTRIPKRRLRTKKRQRASSSKR